MAKTTKGGLGRGLGSLLNATTEDHAREVNVVVDEKRAEEAIIVERSVQTEKVSPIREQKPIDNGATSPQAANRGQKESSEDNIEIKEIVTRQVEEVPINEVSPNPDQPRTSFNKEEIEELAASIKKDGVLQPILVRMIMPNTYQIIAGERRWQACKSLGMKKIPIRIKEADPDKALELSLIENLQRVDLNPIEEAYGYKRLMERQKLTQSDVAQMMSKGRSTIANALRLLDLPESAQQLLYEEKITPGHARAILSVPTKENREKLTQKVIADNLSVRETENIARLLSGKKSTSKREPLPERYTSVAHALRKILNTNVRVKSSHGKNKLEIEFKDEEELEKLFDSLSATTA